MKNQAKATSVWLDEYGVGRTQIQQTIKRKVEYMTAYEDNSHSCRKRLCTRLISDDLENSVWSWFEKPRSMNNPVSGTMLQERALLTTDSFNRVKFCQILRIDCRRRPYKLNAKSSNKLQSHHSFVNEQYLVLNLYSRNKPDIII